MKKTISIILMILFISTISFAAAHSEPTLYRTPGGTYYMLSEPLPSFTSVEIDGVTYLIELSAASATTRTEQCVTCILQLGNHAPELDGWYRYSVTHHQYRTYYYANCTICHTMAYVFTPGPESHHSWKYVSDRHAWDDLHAIVEHCRICGESMTSYVFCPGPDGGGCTVKPGK